MSTAARKRLMRDFRKLQADPPEGVQGNGHSCTLFHRFHLPSRFNSPLVFICRPCMSSLPKCHLLFLSIHWNIFIPHADHLLSALMWTRDTDGKQSDGLASCYIWTRWHSMVWFMIDWIPLLRVLSLYFTWIQPSPKPSFASQYP